MTLPRLALADELAEIRAEILRLKQREKTLASLEHAFPVVPVFRSRRLAAVQTDPAPKDASAHA